MQIRDNRQHVFFHIVRSMFFFMASLWSSYGRGAVIFGAVTESAQFTVHLDMM
jgi:hypothetical protein